MYARAYRINALVTQDVQEEASCAEIKQDSDRDPFTYSLRFNSLRFKGVPTVVVNVIAEELGPLGLSVGFQTRPSGLGLRGASAMRIRA